MLLAALLAVSSTAIGAVPTTIYVSNTNDNAIQIHLWKNGGSDCSAWASDPTMTYIRRDGDNRYHSYTPACASYDRMIVRDSKGQSADLTIPTDGKNLYDWPSNTWGYYTVNLEDQTLYYDDSVTKFSDSDNLYLGLSTGTWTEANRKLNNAPGSANAGTRVAGTKYLFKYVMPNNTWKQAFCWLISNSTITGANNPCTKLQEITDGTYPYIDNTLEAFSSSYVYQGQSSTQTWGSKDLHEMLKYEYEDNFEITYSAPSNGTLTVKDYDNNNVTSGSNKCILTVLKITATPADGYVVGSAMVGGVDYTAQAREGTFEHTVTASTAVSVTFVSNPTVLIAEDESVSGDNVTLNGHIQFTRCYAVTEYGFVYGTSANPTTSNHKEVVGTAAIAGTHYTKTFSVESNATYHYRAYMIAGGATYYSAEDRTFEIDASCNATSKSIIEPRINGSTTASALVNESVSLSGTVHADVYLWTCKTKPDGATVTFGNSANRNTTVSVDKSGTYTFTLKANCTSGTVYESDPVTLYVCAPPSTPQTLYLDNHEDNIICVGETSTATIISETGYTYNLYRGDDFIGSYTGTGATLTWRNVEGVGTFYIKTTPAGTPNCAVTFASATQAYNAPVINITATPGTSVLASKDVVLTKDGSSTIDTNLKWEITQNHEGYLLYKSDNVIDNRKEYAGRERESVYFKGGVVNNAATTYKVTGTGTRTVNIPGGSGEKKTCEASSTVTITVSPATESCTP